MQNLGNAAHTGAADTYHMHLAYLEHHSSPMRFSNQNRVHAVLICRLRRKRRSALPPKCFA
jgi:hypothetical protein